MRHGRCILWLTNSPMVGLFEFLVCWMTSAVMGIEWMYRIHQNTLRVFWIGFWMTRQTGIQLDYIQPEKPQQNASVERITEPFGMVYPLNTSCNGWFGVFSFKTLYLSLRYAFFIGWSAEISTNRLHRFLLLVYTRNNHSSLTWHYYPRILSELWVNPTRW